MKEKNILTKTQREIYNSVTTKDWFTIFDSGTWIRNRDSQCRKIAGKGYFEHKVNFDPDHPGDLTMLISFFKKVNTTHEEKEKYDEG